MTATVLSRLQSLQPSEFVLLVSQALGKRTIEILDWQCQPVSGGASQYDAGGLGVYHISGTAADQEGAYPWSLILKALSGTTQTGSNDPAAYNDWKREVLAYQSGLLANLPGSLSAPRCYAVAEYPGEEFWLWLEDIQEPADEWTLERHGLAARHLGQFNGAYLAGYPLPAAQPWLTWGRTREWLTEVRPYIERSHLYTETLLGRRLFIGNGYERTLHLWANHQRLLGAFEQLPVCFCHHDAFRRNLLAHQTAAGASETVAIDWSITGYGRVGEEIGVTTAVNLTFMEVNSSLAKELDQAIFAGYVDGLHDAGWQGDVRLARLGYATNASLTFGAASMIYHLENLQNPDSVMKEETILGHPLDEIIEQWAAAQLLFLDLGEEAIKLMQELA